MNKLLIVFSFLILSSCTIIKVDDRGIIVTSKIDKPLCDIKKVDENCKIEGNIK